jgi:hypothetical protein
MPAGAGIEFQGRLVGEGRDDVAMSSVELDPVDRVGSRS